MKTINVRVDFSGVVSVENIPDHLSDADAGLLATKFAMARILATTNNPDAPDEDAFDEYGAECSSAGFVAGEAWNALIASVDGGEWLAGPAENIVQELLAKVTAAKVPEDYFDEAVHDIASADGSAVNNGGHEAQIRYLLQECGEQEARKTVDEAVDAARTNSQ